MFLARSTSRNKLIYYASHVIHMSALQRLIEEEEEVQEFANLAFSMLAAVDDREGEIQELIEDGKNEQAFHALKSDPEEAEEQLQRMYEISTRLHQKYPELMEELEDEIGTPQ